MQFVSRPVPFVVVLLLFVSQFSTALAQEVPLSVDVPVHGVTSYSDDIPTPEEVIGHQIGTRHTTSWQMERYFREIAELSDRVTLREHGATYDGRPVIHAIVTTPERQPRIDQIRERNLRLSNDPGSVSDAELQQLPVVVNMGYSVHGNEASGTEAAILLLYHLAAGEGPAIDEILENTVTIIDPLLNPDGRDRFADWVNRNRGGAFTTDPQNREHNEAWPGGRGNHYWFDLNRDWLPVQHPSSQGRIELFHQWRPQVLTDFHEMGSNATYFFQPGIASRTNPNTPQINQDLTAELGEFHAQYLDEIGTLYYTEESFDDFYYGKGSTYPDIHGSVGILFEQASSRALERETDHGVVNYGQTVRNQFLTSLSTLHGSVQIKEDLLRYQRDFFGGVEEFANDFEISAYVIDSERYPQRAQELARILQHHQIRLHELNQSITADGHMFQPGRAYVVPVNQTQGHLVKASLERTHTYPDSIFYDVSTWTLPLAFGLDYAELEQNPAGLMGAEMEPAEYGGGQLVGGQSDYAYVMEWGRYFAPRALYRLQEANIRPRIMTDELTIVVNGQQHEIGRGGIVIPVEQLDADRQTVHQAVREAVAEDHVRIFSLETGLTPSGPDIGSRGSSVLQKPEIALITGPGATSTNAGEVWHLLSERFEIPITLIDAGDVSRRDLSRYNRIVLAGGSYSPLDTTAITDWVQDGGRLITLGSATNWAVREDLLELEERTVDLDSLMQGVPYADLADTRGAQQIGGSIFQAVVDNTHPIAYGYGDRAPFFRRGTTFYARPDRPGATVAYYDEDETRLSGYLSDEMYEHAAGSASIVTQSHGSGRVIAFTDNPNFRAFWYGTNGLFLNALFFGDVI